MSTHLGLFYALRLRYIYPYPQECDTKSIFKQSLIGLNSELYFYTSCYTKVKGPNVPTIYP